MSLDEKGWVDFANTIKSCASQLEELMRSPAETVYFENGVPKQWQEMERYELVVGSRTGGYRPAPILLDLVSAITAQSNRLHSAPEISNWMMLVEKECRLYHDARSRRAYTDHQHHYMQVKDLAWRLECGLVREIDAFKHHVNSEFGFADSVTQKFEENKYCIYRAKSLVDSLAVLDWAWLDKVAGNDRQLNQVLLVELGDVIDGCRTKLGGILDQLESNLWKFRQMSECSKLFWAFKKHVDQVGTVLRDADQLPKEKLLKSPFNVVQPFALKGHVHLDDLGSKAVEAIVGSLPQRKEEVSLADVEQEEGGAG